MHLKHGRNRNWRKTAHNIRHLNHWPNHPWYKSRAISRQDFYDRLEIAANENTNFEIAKQRHRATLDTKLDKYI